jgi:hypothetical protein
VYVQFCTCLDLFVYKNFFVIVPETKIRKKQNSMNKKEKIPQKIKIKIKIKKIKRLASRFPKIFPTLGLAYEFLFFFLLFTNA